VQKNHYVVATIRPWNIAKYHDVIPSLPGIWHLISDPEKLTSEYIASIKPRYIFFPHWSHKVAAEIIEKYECVCFHITELPFGRGGSPLQNLIIRGFKSTTATSLRMTEDFDAGPIYTRQPLSLSGLAEEIYLRTATVVYEMIREIVEKEPVPTPQTGEPTIFKRRTPEQSIIPEKTSSLEGLFDHIRMLDAEEYPKAFLEFGDFRFEFNRPALKTGQIEATVKITMKNDKVKN